MECRKERGNGIVHEVCIRGESVDKKGREQKIDFHFISFYSILFNSIIFITQLSHLFLARSHECFDKNTVRYNRTFQSHACQDVVSDKK
jgi:elongation factor P--beta-lysine ligase